MPANTKPRINIEKYQFHLSGKIIELDENHAIIETNTGTKSIAVFSAAEKISIAAMGDAFHVGKMVQFKNIGNQSSINFTSIAEIYSPATTFKLTQTPELMTPPANNPRSIFNFMQTNAQYGGEMDMSPHPILERLTPTVKSPMSADQANKIKKLRAATKLVVDGNAERFVTVAEMEEQANPVGQLPGTIRFDENDRAIFVPSGSAAALAQMKSPRRTEVAIDMQTIPELGALPKPARQRQRPSLSIQTNWNTPATNARKFLASGYVNPVTHELVDVQVAEEKRASVQNANNVASDNFMTRVTPDSLRYHELHLAIQAAIEANDNPHVDIKTANVEVVRDRFAVKKLKNVMNSPLSDKVSMIIREAQQYAAENITERRPFCCIFSRKVELTPVEKLCKLIANIELSKLNDDSLADIKNKLLAFHPAAVSTPKNER